VALSPHGETVEGGVTHLFGPQANPGGTPPSLAAVVSTDPAAAIWKLSAATPLTMLRDVVLVLTYTRAKA
jgi:hypothetical protein